MKSTGLTFLLIEHLFHLGAPRYHYKANSFTEYTLPGGDRARNPSQKPSDLQDRFSNHINMQIRLDPSVVTATFFYAVSEDGREYSILGVGH